MELKIDGWKNEIRFSSAHLIPGYNKCARLHGHSYAIHARIIGEPDDNGIIVDFAMIKRQMKEIADELDHKLLIPKLIPKGKLISGKNVKLIVDEKEYSIPLEDCAILPIKSSSAEELAGYVLRRFLEKVSLPKKVERIEIGIDEGWGQGAWISKEIGERRK
jgi:6-pyruvoyltetrahydropterin/6-carboxytetrahydropterin synthase